VHGFLLAMPAPAGDGSGGNPFLTFLPFVLMIVVVWFLLIRPQRKRQKEQQAMINSLAKGDRVVTSSGMFGTVIGFGDKENVVVLKVGEDTKIEFLKSAIAGKAESR
jgi:preprotein translocase subunit YajC